MEDFLELAPSSADGAALDPVRAGPRSLEQGWIAVQHPKNTARASRHTRRKPAQEVAVLTRTLAFSVLAVAGVLSTMLLPCQALAQDPTPEGGSKASASEPAAKPASRSGSKRISLDDEFMVEGKLEKPSAFFVFKRSALDYDWARLDAQFSPLVLESVQDPLF
jgi:hypothetical protein